MSWLVDRLKWRFLWKIEFLRWKYCQKGLVSILFHFPSNFISFLLQICFKSTHFCLIFLCLTFHSISFQFNRNFPSVSFHFVPIFILVLFHFPFQFSFYQKLAGSLKNCFNVWFWLRKTIQMPLKGVESQKSRILCYLCYIRTLMRLFSTIYVPIYLNFQ